MKTQLLVVSLLLWVGAAQAEIYRSVDEHGNQVFTDLPDSKSEPVKLKSPSTYKAPSLPSFEAPAPTDNQTGKTYQQFSVVEPGDGQAFWDNTGDVRVSLSLEPALKTEEGHRVQFYLDGVAQGEPISSLSAVINNVERGEHQIYAKLISTNGAEISRTPTTSFQIHRQSINFPARKASPGP